MMTDAEILAAFPTLTAEDLDELRDGTTEWMQATDTEGDTYRIWFNEGLSFDCEIV
jgi:hypothetical protein